MAPKKNKQREKQEQSRASSSARAHQSLLGSTTSAAPPAFIGFSSFAQPAPNAVQARGKFAGGAKPVVQTIYDGSDHEITLALKMLAKKGTVTKVKALHTFLQEVLPPRKPAEIRAMLGHFAQLYTFEMRDQNDRKVRQLLNEVLGAIASKLKPRAFTAHLQRLLPYWYLAMHDVNADVAVEARKAFDSLCGDDETRAIVVVEHLPAIMAEYEQFFSKTPDTFEGISLQPDECEERFERCVSAAVASINAIITLLAEQDLVAKLSDDTATTSVEAVVTSDKFLRLATASSKHPNFSRDSVRRATYVALVTLCTKAKSLVVKREEAFGKVVLGVFSDKSPVNHEAMWNAVLTFLQTFPGVWHSSASFPRYVVSAVYPRLFSQIRHGFFGSGRSSFPTLLPLLSMIPLDVAVNPVNGHSALYTGVLEQCLKFLESKDARFAEEPAITAFFECVTGFFSIFLNAKENAAWLNEQQTEPFASNYVSQFEKALTSSVVTAVSLPSFPGNQVKRFATSLLEMTSRLRSFSFSADSAVGNAVKGQFTATLHVWIRKALSAMTTKLVFVPSRMNELIAAGVADSKTNGEAGEAEQWALTAKVLYHECLVQIDELVATPKFTAARNLSLLQLLEVISGLCGVLPLETLFASEDAEGSSSVEAHFDSHYRSVIRVLAEWSKYDRKGSAKTMHAALGLTRPFFLAARMKKQFLLQLFQNCDVQFGDMAEATDIIQHGLQFPVTDEGCKLWLSCGSWQNGYTSALNATTSQTDATLEALQAIWQGKLLDEFLMISLKGRLDDLDADAFATLLSACLGGSSSFPVVSSDAVVILCHFVIQNGPDSSDDVVMRILTHLCELFLKLNGDLPDELEAVEVQLYQLLFHLSARGNYRAEASALWARTVRHSLKQWTSARTEAFASDLAAHVNSLLVADLPAGTVNFNSKQYAAYAKSYLLLSTDKTTFSVPQLVEKLDAIHLRCTNNEKQPLFFSRVLQCLGELSDDEQAIGILQTYLVQLASQDEVTAVGLVAKLVDLDVTHALTWAVFHSYAGDESGDELMEILESYLTLERLYEAVKASSSVLDKALLHVLAACQGRRERSTPQYRNWVFESKNHGEAPIAGVSDNATALTFQQHGELDDLTVATLSIYSSQSSRASTVQEVVDSSGDWKAAAVQSVAMSLLRVVDAEEDEEVSKALQSFFRLCERDALQDVSTDFFEYLRVATKALSEEMRLPDAASPCEKLQLLSSSTLECVLTRLQALLAPGSLSVVETADWIAATEYVSALSTSSSLLDGMPELRPAWEKVARLLITHSIAGKTETAKVTALKIHKRSAALTDEEQVVLAYSQELVQARLALLGLLSAMQAANADALQELAAHYREALLAAVLCSFSEGVELKANVVTTYVGLTAPSHCFRLVSLWLGVEKLLATVLPALRATLMSIHDVDHVQRLVLESFGGVEVLAALFNGRRYPLPPTLRVLLYILASHSGVLRLRSYDAKAIDVNADDESATEAALAKMLIPKALRSALRAVFTDEKDGSGASNIRMRSRKQKAHEREDIVGKLLLWDLFLQLFPASGGAESSQDATEGSQDVSSTLIASALSSYASRHGLLTNFLTFGSTLLSQESQTAAKASSDVELTDTTLFDVNDLEQRETDADVWSFHKARVFQLATRVFFRTVIRLPAMVRAWWNDECSRATRSWAAKYFEDHITPSVLAAELALIQQASEAPSAGSDAWDEDEMTVKGSRVSREITTTYVKDECALEMVVRVPSNYPLRCVEVECTKRIGIAEDRWRRWVLQIIRVTSSRDGSLLDAVLLWKRNVDQEFEGVEPCPICYSILNPKNMGLPSLPCKTCSNKYHNSCLYKWFNQSGKNKCPICQQPFTG